MSTLTIIAYLVAVAVALQFGRWWGRFTHPDLSAIRAERDAARSALKAAQQVNEEWWEERYNAGYERGRLDQAETEAAKRSESATRGAATRRNRVTGEVKPTFVRPMGAGSNGTAPSAPTVDMGEGPE